MIGLVEFSKQHVGVVVEGIVIFVENPNFKLMSNAAPQLQLVPLAHAVIEVVVLNVVGPPANNSEVEDDNPNLKLFPLVSYPRLVVV